MKYNLVSDSWDKNEIQAINKVISSGIYTYKGKFVAEYENKISKFFKVKYCVSVNSGSSANLLALSSFKFKKGSEIITPSLTFATTVAPIYQLGLIPHFIGVVKNKFVADKNLKMQLQLSPQLKILAG